MAAWPSLLSLDAVFVAVVWQQLLMRSFCSRSSTWPEMVSLTLSVWLIYVADRLLDAAKLDLAQPHTLRHRFYHRHRPLFLGLWCAVLVINTFVVVRYLPVEILRNGLVLGAAVLAYGASVHFSANNSTNRATEPLGKPRFEWLCLPKEIRVGTLFALGVSLTVWTQLSVSLPSSAGSGSRTVSSLCTLAAATCAIAVLFSCNCVLVARFERAIDQAQSFPSIVSSYDCRNLWCGHAVGTRGLVIAMFALPMGLLLRLPVSLVLAILGSVIGLTLSLVLPATPRMATSPFNSPASFDIRSVWVDAVLWTPPLVMLCFT
ncbi:MAG: hypothetical protein ABI557_05235 [Aureliella sp.]